MKQRVFRYLFPIGLDTNEEFTIDMPKGTKILSVGIKPLDFTASFWTLVNAVETDVETRKFVILGTGFAYDVDSCKFNNRGELKFIGTIIEQKDNSPNDCWVWHIFEIL